MLEAGWGLSGASLEPLGRGHINDTLLVRSAAREPVVLQRINEQVFVDAGLVMANLERVQAHLETAAPGLIPPLVKTLTGQSAFVDEQGGWWRLWHFLPDGRTIEQTRDPIICREAGRAFGRFQRLLSDLPGPPLEPTIPGFLELGGYLERFDQISGATADAEAAIAEAGGRDLIDAQRYLVKALPKGETVIHGDCKLNNLLFAGSGSAVRAVLDLDTIMAGHWAWDFGDLARSVLTGALDGEQTGDSAAIPDLFAALVAGFSSGCGRPLEPRLLALAPAYVAFMLGVRFLTDHLQGDRYFKVSRRGENLSRARRQFQLNAALPIDDLEAIAEEVLKD